MNEHSFIKSVHRSLHTNVTKWKIHDRYNGGVPDAFYIGGGGCLWAEYKYIKTLPVRDTTNLNIDLKPLQAKWLNILFEANQNVCLVVGAEDTALILKEQEWLQDITKQHYIKNSIPRKEVSTWIQSICLLDSDGEAND